MANLSVYSNEKPAASLCKTAITLLCQELYTSQATHIAVHDHSAQIIQSFAVLSLCCLFCYTCRHAAQSTDHLDTVSSVQARLSVDRRRFAVAAAVNIDCQHRNAMRQLLRLQLHLKSLMRCSCQVHSGPRGVAAAAGAAAGGQHSQLAVAAWSMRTAALIPGPRAVQQPLRSCYTFSLGSRGFAHSAAATEVVSSRRKTSPPQAYGAEQIQVTACVHAHQP